AARRAHLGHLAARRGRHLPLHAPGPEGRRMSGPIDVLMVDDSPEDVRLVEEALRGGELAVRLHSVSDGQEALEFLHRRPPFAEAPRPRLMLLDLNLPRVDGREVLAAVKGDPRLRGIPVVVLSTTASPDDVQRAYSLYANCFVT